MNFTSSIINALFCEFIISASVIFFLVLIFLQEVKYNAKLILVSLTI